MVKKRNIYSGENGRFLSKRWSLYSRENDCDLIWSSIHENTSIVLAVFELIVFILRIHWFFFVFWNQSPKLSLPMFPRGFERTTDPPSPACRAPRRDVGIEGPLGAGRWGEGVGRYAHRPSGDRRGGGSEDRPTTNTNCVLFKNMIQCKI